MAFCAEITCHSDAHYDLTVLSSASASGSRRGDCNRELDDSRDDQTCCRALLPRRGIELGVTTHLSVAERLSQRSCRLQPDQLVDTAP
jgi:hypothetical protein